MKMIQPKPFTFEAGKRAVLLLHGFTGHSADVRMLGRFLEKKGYTSHAPIYRGHGVAPEELIKTNPDEWWEDVLTAYKHLQELGYQEIAVAGLSLGGALGLKLAYSTEVKGIITMCAPMFFNNETQLTKGFKSFAKEYKELEGKESERINQEVSQLVDNSQQMFTQLGDFIKNVQGHIDTIYTPTFVIQAGLDQIIDKKSATYIYEHVEADKKEIKWYEKSTHVITLDQEKEKLNEDIYQFLQSLDWSE